MKSGVAGTNLMLLLHDKDAILDKPFLCAFREAAPGVDHEDWGIGCLLQLFDDAEPSSHLVLSVTVFG